MDDEKDAEVVQDRRLSDGVRRVITIVYIAMIASIGVYAAMVRFLVVPRIRPAPRPSIEWGLFAAGAAEYLLATFLGRRMLSAHIGGTLERVRSFFLIRFAAAEAIAVFGLALFFLGSPAGHSATFFAASVAAFLFAYPGPDAFSEAIARAQETKK